MITTAIKLYPFIVPDVKGIEALSSVFYGDYVIDGLLTINAKE